MRSREPGTNNAIPPPQWQRLQELHHLSPCVGLVREGVHEIEEHDIDGALDGLHGDIGVGVGREIEPRPSLLLRPRHVSLKRLDGLVLAVLFDGEVFLCQPSHESSLLAGDYDIDHYQASVHTYDWSLPGERRRR